MLRTILPDGGIRDGNAQLGQFSLDAPAAPSGIGLPHPVNQSDEIFVGGRFSKAEPGSPAPKEPEATAMPYNDGWGLEEDQGKLPCGQNHRRTTQSRRSAGRSLGLRGCRWSTAS